MGGCSACKYERQNSSIESDLPRSVFGFPFLHAVLPHSPLHVKCLADTEERVENGYVRDIVVRVRETRLTNLFSNILIGISMLFLGYVLEYIPTAVLDGLFLYLALTALYGNQVRSQKFLLNLPGDKMNLTVRFGTQISERSPCLPRQLGAG